MKQFYFPNTLLENLSTFSATGAIALCLLFLPLITHAQGGSFCDGSDANAGNIKLDSDFGNPSLLNPDSATGSVNIFQGDAYDPLSGLTEMEQFKLLTSTGYNGTGTDITGTYSCDQSNIEWREITGVVNGDEPNNDLSGGSGCGATDIIHDGSASGYGYYAVVDQDCDPNTVSDAYLIVRMRIAKESSGAFGFSLLVDTDNNCAGWIPDVGSNCASHCFEREIWLGTGGGQTGLHVKDVSGGASPGTEIGVIPISETQVACTSKAIASCKTGNHSTIFYTFAVSFDLLGINISTLNLGLAPATSNNPDDIIDGNYAFSDVGGVNGTSGSATGCSCTGLTGACLNMCLLSCAAAGNGVAFPVELISFNGTYINNSIQLEWQTASELNNQKFIIERLSVTDQNFMPIGEMGGNGTTNDVSFYYFEDKNPLPGSNFYRLRQVDFDGQHHYSAILEVGTAEDQLHISIQSNGLSDQLDMNIFSPESKDLEVQVFSTNGNLLISRAQTFIEGTNQVSVKTSALAPGLYFVRLVDEFGYALPAEKYLKF